MPRSPRSIPRTGSRRFRLRGKILSALRRHPVLGDRRRSGERDRAIWTGDQPPTGLEAPPTPVRDHLSTMTRQAQTRSHRLAAADPPPPAQRQAPSAGAGGVRRRTAGNATLHGTDLPPRPASAPPAAKATAKAGAKGQRSQAGAAKTSPPEQRNEAPQSRRAPRPGGQPSRRAPKPATGQGGPGRSPRRSPKPPSRAPGPAGDRRPGGRRAGRDRPAGGRAGVAPGRLPATPQLSLPPHAGAHPADPRVPARAGPDTH